MILSSGNRFLDYTHANLRGSMHRERDVSPNWLRQFPGMPLGMLQCVIENMRKQAQKFGAEFKAGAVTEVDLHKRPFKVTAGKHTYEAEALIVAAGASARLLGLKGERELIGHGISTCATCDGYFFRGKPIAVVGGGDSAMEEANFLSRYASKVYLIHRRNEFRASKIMIDRAKKNEKIEFVTPFVVEEAFLSRSVTTRTPPSSKASWKWTPMATCSPNMAA